MSAPMVRAILEGRKTVTRRIVKPQPVSNGYHFDAATSTILCHCDYLPPDCLLQPPNYDDPFLDQVERKCPYGEPGDRLWVRETFALECSVDGIDQPLPHNDGRPHRRHHDHDNGSWWQQPHYRATDPDPELVVVNRDGEEEPGVRWRPSIHMPRWASRIYLRVTSVRVERLQAITEDDARAEGVTPFPYDPEGDCWTAAPPEHSHRTAFEFLWGEINGFDVADARVPGSSWAENPWVWVVGFERVEAAP